MKRPTLSIVIVTAALAEDIPQSSGKQAHAFRAYLLRNFLLPQLCDSLFVSEIIVVGEFEDGDGYTYIHVPSVERSSIHDGIRKRHIGTQAATGEWICVMNDDHWFASDAFTWLWPLLSHADVVSPARWTRLRGKDERLNGGEPGGAWSGPGHINGHCTFFKREALAACPWDALPRVFTFDVAQTERLREQGFHIEWAENVRVYDIEHGSEPWR